MPKMMLTRRPNVSAPASIWGVRTGLIVMLPMLLRRDCPGRDWSISPSLATVLEALLPPLIHMELAKLMKRLTNILNPMMKKVDL